MLGIATRLEGDPQGARRYYEQSLELHRRIGDRVGLSTILGNLAQLERDVGNLARSRELLEEDLNWSRRDGSELDVVWALKELAGTAVKEGGYDETRELAAEGFELTHEVRFRDGGERLVLVVAIP